MQFFFDHLVWFFKEPEKAISSLKQRGLHVVKGGRMNRGEHIIP